MTRPVWPLSVRVDVLKIVGEADWRKVANQNLKKYQIRQKIRCVSSHGSDNLCAEKTGKNLSNAF
jgi:hypothetical protein